MKSVQIAINPPRLFTAPFMKTKENQRSEWSEASSHTHLDKNFLARAQAPRPGLQLSAARCSVISWGHLGLESSGSAAFPLPGRKQWQKYLCRRSTYGLGSAEGTLTPRETANFSPAAVVAVIWTPDHQRLSAHNQISLKIYITTWELTTHSKGVNGAEARGCDKAPPRSKAASLIHSPQASYLPTRAKNACGRNCQELATTTHTPTITPSTGHLGIESYSQIAWSQPPDSCWAVTLVEGTDGTAPSTWKVCRTPTDARTPLASPR